MRDLDRVRDKIEIRLEPRQVALLAASTMVFSGLLFAAGFMLGRRQAPPPTTPVAVLGGAEAEQVSAGDTADAPIRAAAIGEVTFEFPSMLGSRPGKSRPARRPMRLNADVVTVPKVAEKPVVEAAKPVVEGPKPIVDAPEPVVKAPKPIVEAPEPVAARVPTPALVVVPDPPAAVSPTADDEDDPDAGAAPPVPPPAKADARYTLQVKAVRDKGEADAFIAELRRAGFSPHTVLAEIPGKGRFYRIRVGHFPSMAEARVFQRQFKRRSGQPDGGFVTDL